jgi:hypothetical protein
MCELPHDGGQIAGCTWGLRAAGPMPADVVGTVMQNRSTPSDEDESASQDVMFLPLANFPHQCPGASDGTAWREKFGWKGSAPRAGR